MQVNILRYEQTRLLYAGLVKAVTVNALLALILVTIQQSVVNPVRLFGWLALIGAVLLARAVLAVVWRQSELPASHYDPHWLRCFRIGVIATGMAWGIGAVFLFPAGNLSHQVFLAFVLAWLNAVAITSLSVDRVSTLGFLVPSLLPLMVRFIMEVNEISLAMGIMIALFLFFAGANSISIGRSLMENIQLRIKADMREQSLSRSDERLKEAQRVAHLGSFEWNPVSGKLQWSDEHFRLWGLEPQSVTPDYALFRKGIHPDDVAKTEEILQRALIGGRVYDCVHRVVRPDGSERYIYGRGEVAFDDAGQAVRMIGTVLDITEQKLAEEAIHNLAFYDQLTDLPNRRLLQNQLQHILASSARNKHYGAILFIDLDNFKGVNDTKGHHVGDLLLIEVARRLKASIRADDTLARLGGDEFVVILEDIGTKNEQAAIVAETIAEKVRGDFTQPFMLEGMEYHGSPSIGISLFLGKKITPEELLKRADMAMYQAKDSGRNRVQFFDPSIQQSVETRAALESDLRRAIPDQQLQLHYQIQVDHDQRPVGAEALIRWIHPQRGMVSPAHFIPVAEESSLILEIGHWVLDTACEQIAAWSKNEQTRNLVLAINISAQQFKQRDFVEQVDSMIHKHRIDPSRLKLELTESVVLDDIDVVVAKMQALRQVQGITLSLDDFGTGYSSLSYLKQLPLDQIKIDQSFVRDMTTDASDAVMVKTIIDMAQNFGLNVIAEGVETEAQLALLKQHGCMAYQGYLFSKPTPIEQFEALLN
ncbi:MAG: EAL domain-containing protein [Nitrosomonadales bacterium]|nr:MAG: EAL domain-containing protein [Nitrosomonadales bacterium]